MSSVALVFVFLLDSAVPQTAFSDEGFVEASYRMPKGEVGDEFLSFLVAIVDSDRAVAIDRAGLQRGFPVYANGDSSIFARLREVARRKASDQAKLEFSFFGDLHVPVPFGILWYHPIWIDTSGAVLLGESRSTSRTLVDAYGRQIVIGPEYRYRLERGHASIRIDRWLTILTFGLLTDFSFQAVSLFRKGDSWYGLLVGRGRDDRPICWLFSLTAMRVVLPMPEELAHLASELISTVP